METFESRKMQFIDIKPSCNQLQTFSNGFTSFARPLGANYSAIILEEVALEGLDGITKSMLNYRLKNRRGFQPNLNDGFLLEILCHHVQKGRISIFKLDNERSFVLPYDRYVNVDAEGIIGNIIDTIITILTLINILLYIFTNFLTNFSPNIL